MLPQRACSECPVRRTPARWGPARGGLASATGFSAGFSTVGVTVVATAVGAGAGFGAAAGAAVATAAGVGAGAGAGAAQVAPATAAFCRAIEPVTESSPCSRTVTREYSRSRSPLSVSIADASLRVSSWPSLAIDWICCSCRARSATATCSCRSPIEDWLAYSATATALTATAPQDASLSSERRSKSSSSAKSPASTPPEFSVSKPPARWMGCFAIGILRPPKARRITPRTLTGNGPAAGIRPLAGWRIGFPLRLKASKTAAQTSPSWKDEG